MQYPHIEQSNLKRISQISCRDLKLGFMEIECLLCYAVNFDSSIYHQWQYFDGSQVLNKDIRAFKRKLKRTGEKSDYSNFKKLTSKLKRKGLLCNNPSKHPVLTDSAIVLLLRDYKAVYLDIFKSLLGNYPNSIIFDTFLYPFFAKKTLFRIFGTYHGDVLLKYLHDCCDEVAKYQLSNKTTKAFGDFLFKWDGLDRNVTQHINETNFVHLRDFLKHDLSLNWTDNAEITLVEDGEKMRISSGLNSLQICLSQNKEEADLIIKGQKKITLKISCYPDLEGNIFPWCVHKPAVVFEEIVKLQFLLGRIKTLVFTMLTNMYDKALFTNQAFLKEDMEILCKDRKFMQAINYLKSTLESKRKSVV